MLHRLAQRRVLWRLLACIAGQLDVPDLAVELEDERVARCARLEGELDDGGVGAELEDRFFIYEVHLNKQAFLQQFQYAVFYAYMKLKEQEIRSLTWIAECIAQNARDRIHDFIPTF